MLTSEERIRTVVEDLRYIKDQWGQKIDDAHLRRGSTTLRRLLVEGELQRAWKAAGLLKEPFIHTATLAFIKQISADQILVASAGGAQFHGGEVRNLRILKSAPEKSFEAQ